MSKTIKPFNNAPYTQQHNYVYDQIMRDLSGNAYKVLSVAIRFTAGYHVDSDQISYSQFQEFTGIASRSTIHRAIKECLDHGFLERKIDGYHQGTKKPIYRYSLVKDYAVTIASPEIGLSKERKKETKKNAVAVVLSEFGIVEPWLSRMAEAWDLETAKEFIHQARANPGLDNPQGYLVERFKAGDKPLPVVANTARNGERIDAAPLGGSVEEGSVQLPSEDPLPEHVQLWDQAISLVIIHLMEPATFDSMFRPLEPVMFSGGVLTVEGPARCIQWVNHWCNRYNGKLNQLVSEAIGQEIIVELVEVGGSME